VTRWQLAAASIAVWQSRAQHRSSLALLKAEQRHSRIELSKTLAALAHNCSTAVSYVSAHFPDREAVHNVAEGEVNVDLEEIRRIDSALRSIPIHHLPSTLLTPTMVLSATIRQFLGKVELTLQLHRSMNAAQFDDFFITIQQMNESLKATCADIDAEVAMAEGSAA